MLGQPLVSCKSFFANRRTGYRGIVQAISEPVENSIKAGAHDIFVIMTEHINPATRRKEIYEVAILDNGCGMDIGCISSCLTLGFSTNKANNGVGLPLSAIYATSNVEVYSWTEDDGPIEAIEPVRCVSLNINKVITGEQKQISDPVHAVIPQQYRHFLKYRTAGKVYDFTQHGTLVYWKNCDNIKPNRMRELNDKLEFVLGRKFRHLIMDCTHNIRLITIGYEDSAIDVLPNDPLFLMKPNYVLGNLNDPTNISERKNIGCTEPIFETYGDNDGEVIIPISYIDRLTCEQKTSDICVRFSKVRAEFYDQTAISTGDVGSKPIGKYIKKLEGISVVREGIEIDFGVFDFYDKTNNPYHRWWGCEIFFNHELDDVFGVSFNKQFVEVCDNSESEVDYKGETIVPLWNRLAQVIIQTIKKMVEENKVLRKGRR